MNFGVGELGVNIMRFESFLLAISRNVWFHIELRDSRTLVPTWN